MNPLFNDSLGRTLGLGDVVSEMAKFMDAKPHDAYKVIVGTDSELLSNKDADFVTALVVHRVGNGGRYFWRRIELGSFYTLRDRILREVLLSLDIAKDFLIALRNNSKVVFDFEIHVDVGENGATRSIIQEVVGMVRAHNFEPKTKPLSFGASKVADRHC